MTHFEHLVNTLISDLQAIGEDLHLAPPDTCGSMVITIRQLKLFRGHPSPIRLLLLAPERIADTSPASQDVYSYCETLGVFGDSLDVILAMNTEHISAPNSHYWILVNLVEFAASVHQGGTAALRTLLLQHFPLSRLSPYQSYRAVSDDMFFGRRESMHDLCSLRSNIVVCGPRRIGKSSLCLQVLRALRRDANYRHAIGTKRETRYIYSVCYLDAGTLASPDTLWPALLKSMGLELRDLRGGITHKRDFRQKLQHKTDFEILNTLLTHKYKRATILLDEVDSLLEMDQTNNWAEFNRLRVLHDTFGCRIILFGYERLYQAAQSTAFPLFGRNNILQLHGVSYQEIERLVAVPMQELGIRLDDVTQISGTIYRSTGGRPNLVQDICHALLELLSAETRRNVTVHDLKRVLASVTPIEALYRSFLSLPDPLSRLIAYICAPYGVIQAFDVLKQLRENWRIDVDDHNVIFAIERLCFYGIVQPVSHGREYAFDSDILVEKLLQDLGADSGISPTEVLSHRLRISHGRT
ncbi:MAG: ATP-binding protein [Phycisphaerales bacterium]|nr:ATP-binding protein [Phycisphaerales bacterium]